MCLDGTESNNLIHKIEAEMPDLQNILIRWRCAKFWSTIDIVQMFWSSQTHPSDADLQHGVWRFKPDEELMLYQFCRMVMGLTNSPGLARLALIELSKKFANEFPKTIQVLEQDTYMDNSNVLGETEDEVITKSKEVIDCLDRGSFRLGKILPDSKAIMNKMPEECLDPSLKDALERKESVIQGVIGERITFQHPNNEDAILTDGKQLGVHFSINLEKEESSMTYDHWHQGDGTEKLTKREAARSYAKAWNPLHELGPITNPKKACLSKIWKLQ